MTRSCGLSCSFVSRFRTPKDCYYVQDIPNEAMPPRSRWITDAINQESPTEHLQRLCLDGFGLIVKILRNIKTSWRLLLSEMEDFLEDVVGRLIIPLLYACTDNNRMSRSRKKISYNLRHIYTESLCYT